MLRAQETWTFQAETEKGNLSVCKSEYDHHSSWSICDPEAQEQSECPSGNRSTELWSRHVGRMPVSKGKDRRAISDDGPLVVTLN